MPPSQEQSRQRNQTPQMSHRMDPRSSQAFQTPRCTSPFSPLRPSSSSSRIATAIALFGCAAMTMTMTIAIRHPPHSPNQRRKMVNRQRTGHISPQPLHFHHLSLCPDPQSSSRLQDKDQSHKVGNQQKDGILPDQSMSLTVCAWCGGWRGKLELGGWGQEEGDGGGEFEEDV